VITRLRWSDPPTHIRWESARLAEPLLLRRRGFRRGSRLERLDGSPLPTDGSGARQAPGADGDPVRVEVVPHLFGPMLAVGGRRVPSTAPVSPSTGLGLAAGAFLVLLLGGVISVSFGLVVCVMTINVLRCEGDRSTRRTQAAVVAVAGACVVAVLVALGVLVIRALGFDSPVFGILGVVDRLE
jgi:hypothetical protein